MLDAILYVADFPVLVGHLNTHHPEMLERDETGALMQPPVVTGFARTPAVMTGIELMVYARLKDAQAAQWRGMAGVRVLAEAPFTGPGTTDAVYAALFADPDAKAIYDRVYPHEPYTITDPDMGEIVITPPERFGAMAGG
ncbi:hypothetical protein AWR38_00415 [Idiomarina sp. WRN-38]|nr:hypothetical protein AUR68_00415 [Idiomarina sp. H105]OAE97904.1 hypothetical protein AWR38_00415 [Idiomarina sp. WRN-38]